MNNEICVHHHLGLGDQLDCNGLVRKLALAEERVYTFAKDIHFEMISYMYRDNKKIEVIKIDSSKNEYDQVQNFLTTKPGIKFQLVGHKYYDPRLEIRYNLNCWEQFYILANMSSEQRWEGFYFERDLQEEQRVYDKLNPSDETYIFLHDDPSRGYEIDRSKLKSSGLKIITNDITENIFHYAKLIKEAKEIHCMESSFKSLVELVGTESNLYFHDFRNHPLGNNKAGWEIIKYDNS